MMGKLHSQSKLHGTTPIRSRLMGPPPTFRTLIRIPRPERVEGFFPRKPPFGITKLRLLRCEMIAQKWASRAQIELAGESQ
jgi:hypothetical protein